MEKAFGDKPDQLQSIKDTAETFVHPQRKCKMWIVHELCFEAEMKEEHKESKKRELYQDENNAMKVEKIKKVKIEQPKDPQPLNDAQRKRMEKMCQALPDMVKKGEEVTEKVCKDVFLQRFIPEVIQNEMMERLSGMTAALAAAQATLETDWKGDFKRVIDEATEAKQKGKEALDKMALFCDTAEASRPTA